MQECLVAETTGKDKKCFSICFYKSSVQNHEGLNAFCLSLDFLFGNVKDQHPNSLISIVRTPLYQGEV